MRPIATQLPPKKPLITLAMPLIQPRPFSRLISSTTTAAAVRIRPASSTIPTGPAPAIAPTATSTNATKNGQKRAFSTTPSGKIPLLSPIPTSNSRAVVSHPDSAPAFWQIGNLWRVMATGVQTNNSFTLLDQIVHSGGGGGPCTHTHTQDEGLYVINGQCTFNAGGVHGIKAGPGTFVSVPRLTEHSFTVDAPDTHLLNFYLPAGFDVLLIGIAHPAPENRPPPPETVPGMMAPPHLVHKLAADYGQEAVLGMPFVDPPSDSNMRTRPTPGATAFPFTANTAAGDGDGKAGAAVKRYRWDGAEYHVLGSGKQLNGSYAMLEVEAEGGRRTTPRVMEYADQVFYLLEGEMTFLLQDKIEKASKGSLVFIPRGMVHGWKVDSAKGARYLSVCTPAGFERVLEALGDGKGEKDEALAKRVLNEVGLRNLTHV